MQLTENEITELQKFKQYLQLTAKTPCHRAGDKTCVDVPDQNFCPSCYANSILQTSTQPIQTGEPFIVQLDPVSTEPGMTICVEREDKLYPLVTNDATAPNLATQEMILRCLAVLIDADNENITLKESAAKWGLKITLQK